MPEAHKKLFRRQAEVFAAFVAHTDHQIGRLVNAVQEIGETDNTLIFYIAGDNGTSAEGGMLGMYNEMTAIGKRSVRSRPSCSSPPSRKSAPATNCP